MSAPVTPHIPASDSPAPGPRRIFNPRIILLLLGLLAFICASVMAVDWLSPRDRHPDYAPAHAGGNAP